MAKLIVYVAKKGASFHEVDGRVAYSGEGHMFIGVQDNSGLSSWGFQPHGVVPDEHKQYYQTTQISFEISEQKAKEIKQFAQDAENDNKKMGSWWPWNSCVDFSWKALNIAGIKSPSLIWNEGKVYPEDNIKLLKCIS
jgi:hypothetical protein